MDLLQIATGITKWDDYYQLRQYTRDLHELALEPTIRFCGSGQWIFCFDSWQLTIMIWMLNTGYRQFTLAKKVDISHWLPCGENG